MIDNRKEEEKEEEPSFDNEKDSIIILSERQLILISYSDLGREFQ